MNHVNYYFCEEVLCASKEYTFHASKNVEKGYKKFDLEIFLEF